MWVKRAPPAFTDGILGGVGTGCKLCGGSGRPAMAESLASGTRDP
ncbi:MAG: hypothetical protein ACYTG0_22830 [Planctomycetota bacterium]|jgi:hypothetical protein